MTEEVIDNIFLTASVLTIFSLLVIQSHKGNEPGYFIKCVEVTCFWLSAVTMFVFAIIAIWVK